MNRSLLGLLAVGLTSLAHADINDDLEKLGGTAAEGYLGPVVSTLGSNLNQGWFFEAPKPNLWGIDISARTVVVGTMFGSDQETFSTMTSTTIDEQTADLLAKQIVETNANGLTGAARQAAIDSLYNQLFGKSVNMTIAGPTLLGSTKDEITLTMGSKDSVSVPGNSTKVAVNGRKVGLGVSGAGLGGLPVPGIPLLLPQITLGTLAGTQVALRGSPEVAGFAFFGIGINHNPGFWMEAAQLPFGINSSINGAWTKMTYGDFLEFTAWNAGVTASRQFGFRFLNVAPFVSLGMESSKLEVSYETEFNGADGKPLKVSFESEGENSFRMTMGSKVRLLVLDLGASYTIAKYDGMAIQAGLAF